MEPKNNQLIHDISSSYLMIADELARPKGDVVGISVCGATKFTITNVLRLYLSTKNIAFPELHSANDLMAICIESNPAFKQFDTTVLTCRCEPSHDATTYCLGDESIYSCYNLLNEIKSFVFDELKIKEGSFA